MTDLKENVQKQNELYRKFHADIVELICLAQDKMEKIGLTERAFFKDLSYVLVNGKMRICHKSTPLLECSEEVRMELFGDIPELINEAQRAIEKRMSKLDLALVESIREQIENI